MSDLKVAYNRTDKLIPYARNSRTHDEAQVAQIAASIREFGWTNPILIDEQGGIIAGHGRVLAARMLGEERVPCITLRGLSETQKRAYVIADNKLALNAGWDAEMLRVEYEALKEADFPIELTGWGEGEIEDFLKPEDWQSDIHKLEKLEPTNEPAKGRLTVSFTEYDREQVREAITNAIDQLGLEGVSVS